MYCTVSNSLFKGCKKGLLKATLPTPRYHRGGQSIFDKESLREFEAKIAKVLTVAKETCAEPIYHCHVPLTHSLRLLPSVEEKIFYFRPVFSFFIIVIYVFSTYSMLLIVYSQSRVPTTVCTNWTCKRNVEHIDSSLRKFFNPLSPFVHYIL